MVLPRICSICATSNPPQAAFCFGCGQALTKVSATQDLLHQRYHLLHRLGTGGFGSVYQAEDTQLGKRLVAVKEMSSQSNLSVQENVEAAEAFKKEALLLAELQHPNLPRIYDHFSEGGRWYLVMDSIEGETLEEYLAQSSGQHLPLAEALEVGLQLCDVLDYLHMRQPPIIFRDLKPLNIIRTASSHLYLIDFGIARHFKPGQAKDTVAFGSPGYAAPEQYGKTQTTPRSDIYSLGAVLHQMLSGVDPSLNPFRFAPLRLPKDQPTPQSLAALLARMLEMDEAQRPFSMGEVKAALRDIAARVASGSFVAIKSTVPVPKPVRAPVPAPVPTPPPVTYGTLRCAYQGQHQSVRTLAWSPDSRFLVSAGNGNVIDIWNAATGELVRSYRDHAGGIRGVAWAPNGKYIASASEDKTVHVWEASSGKTVLVYRGHSHFVTSVAWSPDNRCMTSSSIDRSVQIWDVQTGYVYVNYTQHNDVVYRTSWSPDGKCIASTGYNGAVRVWEAMSGRHLLTYSGHVGEVLALAWSPDGTFLASGGTNASLQVWEALSGRMVQNYSGSSVQIFSLSWAPDGQRLVSGGAESQVRIWDRATGQPAFVYIGHTDRTVPSGYALNSYSQQLSHPRLEISAVAWSPDGACIASGDSANSIHVWRTE